MKALLVTLASFVLCVAAVRAANDVSIPPREIALIKTADYVEVTGTNDFGGAEDFTIHNAKAIREFVDLLTSDRFTPVPKSLKPQFKSPSAYKIRLSAQGAPLIELQIIGDSIVDLPNEPMYYMEASDYSENLMAPLLRLR